MNIQDCLLLMDERRELVHYIHENLKKEKELLPEPLYIVLEQFIVKTLMDYIDEGEDL